MDLIKELEQMISDDLKMYWLRTNNGDMKRAEKLQKRIEHHEGLLLKLKAESK